MNSFRDMWLTFRQRPAVIALAMALGWTVGSIIASAPFKSVWFGTICMLVFGWIFVSWLQRRRARRLLNE